MRRRQWLFWTDPLSQVIYSALRAADQVGLETVVIAQPVGDGIAVAIRDCLKRATFGITKAWVTRISIMSLVMSL